MQLLTQNWFLKTSLVRLKRKLNIFQRKNKQPHSNEFRDKVFIRPIAVPKRKSSYLFNAFYIQVLIIMSYLLGSYCGKDSLKLVQIMWRCSKALQRNLAIKNFGSVEE